MQKEEEEEEEDKKRLKAALGAKEEELRVLLEIATLDDEMRRLQGRLKNVGRKGKGKDQANSSDSNRVSWN